MATAEDKEKLQEEHGITNPMPQEAPPPPYQPQPPIGYGTGGEAVPPTYDQSQQNLTDAPPTYDSLFGQVRAAKQESSGIAEFFKKFLVIVLGTVGCTICVSLVLAIPVSMIAIGAIYIKDCPREDYIPIYLIVGGCFGILKNISSMAQRIRNQKKDQNEENVKTNPFDGTLNCFLVAWFIAGNVWIYRIYGDYSIDPDDKLRYCNPILYTYAFWITTSIYIIMLTTCCCVCCVGTIASCCGNSGSRSSSN